MIADRLRRAVLKDAFSLVEQVRALFRVLLRTVLIALTCSMLLCLGAFGNWVRPAMAFFAIAALISVVALAVVGYITYTTLQSATLEPLDELSAVARRLGGGDLQATTEAKGGPEFQQISSTLGILANAIVAERSHRLADRRAGEKENTSLREILTITRDVASHLEAGPILVQLASGAKRLGGYSDVVIWRFDELDPDLVPVYPPERLGSAKGNLSRVKVVDSPAGRAATSGQTVRLKAEDGRAAGLAVPLAVGGVGLRILGVIEVRGENAAEAIVANPVDALEALASHAATALAAAQLYEQLEMRSETDALTKVFNRRKLDADLRSEVGRSLRYGHPLTLIMIDVDHFKGINDNFGHPKGDEVLKQVAATIGNGRATDAAYRFGGEEFAVLLRETDITAARAVAERMRIKIRESVGLLGLPRDVTASLGVASISSAIQTPEDLVKAADGALYEAKETGRNRVVVSKLSRGGAAPGGEVVPA